MVQTVQITVEIPHAQFLAMVDVPVVVQRQVIWSKQCRTLFGSSQLQFLDKVIDVPVIFNDTCPWRSRQLQFLDKVIDEPVIFNDTSWSRCGVVPQIMEEIGKVIQLVRIAVEQSVGVVPQITKEIGKAIQLVRTAVEQIVASCHRSWRKTCPLFATTRTHGCPDFSVLDKC